MITDWLAVLVGKSVVAADLVEGRLTLSDGTILEFDLENYECCSWVELTGLATTVNVITAAELRDTEDDSMPNDYQAWVHVVTEAGELRLVEAVGNASSGYYLHGFALNVKVIPPDKELT